MIKKIKSMVEWAHTQEFSTLFDGMPEKFASLERSAENFTSNNDGS